MITCLIIFILLKYLLYLILLYAIVQCSILVYFSFIFSIQKLILWIYSQIKFKNNLKVIRWKIEKIKKCNRSLVWERFYEFGRNCKLYKVEEIFTTKTDTTNLRWIRKISVLKFGWIWVSIPLMNSTVQIQNF